MHHLVRLCHPLTLPSLVSSLLPCAAVLSNAIKFTPHHGTVHVSLQVLPSTPLQQSHMLANNNALQSTAPAQRNRPPSSHHSHSIDIPASNPTSPSPSPSSPTSIPWPPNLSSSAIFRISVRDTGVGVSAENQKKLFSPYMQILPGELQKGAGTGLGLSISLNLIRIHGGEIGYATPDDGVGSEFYMEVPMEMTYRGARGSRKEGATPSGSVRAMHAEGEEKRGDGDEALLGGGGGGGDSEEDEDGVIGALPLNEERQEEDAIIREITDLQQQQQSSRYSTTPSVEPMQASHQSPLYVSRPNVASPDSSMRVLTQQRMHAAHLRQSSHTPLAAPFASSPSILHSSRRLVALARVPVATGGEDGRGSAEESSAMSSQYSSGSRSVSLVMNDAHGPSASPLTAYKRSPLVAQRRLLATAQSTPTLIGGASRLMEQKETDDPAHAHEDGAGDEGERSRVQTPLTSGHSGVQLTPLLHSAPNSSPQLQSAHSLTSTPPVRRQTSADSATPPHRGSLTTLAPPTSSSSQSPVRSDLYITLATYGHGGGKGAAAGAASTGSILSPLRLTVSGGVSSVATLQPSSRALQALQNDQAGEAEVEPSTASELPAADSSSYAPSLSSSTHSAVSTSTGSSAGSGSDSGGVLSSSVSSSAFSNSTSQLASPLSDEAQPERSSVDAVDSVAVRTQLLPVSVASSDLHSASPRSPPSVPTPTSPSALTSTPSPLVQPNPAAGAAPPAVLSPVATAPLLRVLVAEDSLPNLKLLLMLLRKMKVECVGVENGQLAVNAFKPWREHQLQGDAGFALPFDLLLIDGNMPVLGGIEATRQLRAMGVSIPIYAVTGNAMAEDTQEFLRAGANSPVLTKPVQQRELKKIIETQQTMLRKHWRANKAQAEASST